MLLDPDLFGLDREHETYKRVLNEFFIEASLLVSLRHVNVIRVYGVSMDALGIPWMLLELGDLPLDKVFEEDYLCV